jgi:hypothetical protein
MVAAEMDDQKSNELQRFFDNLTDFVIKTDPKQVIAYVDKLRAQNPGITDDALARKIMSRKAMKNGLVGAITGLGGLITLPVAIPADLATTWRVQATMAVAIAYVYGHNLTTTDLKTDIYIIIAGESAIEVLKRLGIEITKAVTKKTIDKYVTREVMKKIWAVIGQKIVTIAGEKSLTSLAKMVPLVGAPVGFVFDWTATRTVGDFAIKYYSGKG